jgi:hypothetical protein
MIKGLSTVLLFCLLLSSCVDFQPNDLQFDPEQWKAGDARLRGRMSRNLLAREAEFIGKARQQIDQLLGTPGGVFTNECEGTEIIYRYDVRWGSIFDTWISRQAVYFYFDSMTEKLVRIATGDY